MNDPLKTQDDSELLKDFRDRDQEACDRYREIIPEIEKDYKFYANHQWEEEDIKSLTRERRPHLTFNQVRSVIDVVVGSEITNRFDIKYLARTPSDSREKMGSIMTETVRYVRDKCRASSYESKAFFDAVLCGYGCIEIYQDYEQDPDGLTMIRRVSPFYMRPDPNARDTNLRDKKYVIRRAWISKDDIAFMWPEGYEKLKDATFSNPGDTSNGNLNIQRLAGYAAKDAGFYRKAASEYLINDYQWYERSSMWRIQDPTSGDLVEAMSLNEKKQLIGFIQEKASAMRYPLSDTFEEQYVTKLPRRDYYRAYICGDVVLSKAKIKTGDFTYYFITGFEDHQEDGTKWFGLMRPMRDPQRYVNKFFSQMVYIMATASKGGLFFEEGTFEDEAEAKRQYAQPNSLIKLLPGGYDKIHERNTANYPTGMESLLEHASNAIPNVSGVNYFLQGLQSGNQPGVVVQSYQKQGMTILSVLFESYNQYKEDIGGSHLEFIRNYMPDNQLIRITDESGGDQIIQYSKDQSAQKYDIVVTQSPTSPNQQKEFWDMMTQTNLLGTLMELGYPVPPSIFNYLPLPDSLRQDWVAEVQQQMQQQQMQEQMMQQQQQQAAGGDGSQNPSGDQAQQAQEMLQYQAELQQARHNFAPPPRIGG